MKHLAVIPARGGSKRIPKKNIKLINGLPLIDYTIKFAVNSSFFDRIIVSTDDTEIASIAKNAGAEVPFLRPDNLSGSAVPDKPVITHCIEWLKGTEAYIPDLIWYLKPTSPIRKQSDLEEIEKLFKENNPDSVRSVSRVEGIDHPYWMYRIDSNGFASPLIEDVSIDKYFQSQLLPPIYRLTGVYEVIHYNTLVSKENLYGERMMIHEMPQKLAVDIDDYEDFAKAERLIKELSND